MRRSERLAALGQMALALAHEIRNPLGAVRGDAERGLLQPLLVRPVHRRTLLAARFASSALVCGAYVIVVFALATTIVTAWWDPDGEKYFTCRAELGVPAKGLADAFEKICAKVSGD